MGAPIQNGSRISNPFRRNQYDSLGTPRSPAPQGVRARDVAAVAIPTTDGGAVVEYNERTALRASFPASQMSFTPVDPNLRNMRGGNLITRTHQ